MPNNAGIEQAIKNRESTRKLIRADS